MVAVFILFAQVASVLPSPPPRIDAATLAQSARVFVEVWAAAQNKLDAKAYFSFYEHKLFRGRKRTQRGVTDFDWPHWQIDRAAMMKSNPVVAVENVAVSAWLDSGSKLARGIVRVRFLQRWRSARFADHGIKVVDLLYDGPSAALHILHEELLNSEPGFADAAPGAPRTLGRISTKEEAERALVSLHLTAGNIESTLATIPDVPQLRREVARVILEGDFTCTQVIRTEECGTDIVEWSALPSDLAWPDPCLRRRAALWAVKQLDEKELERALDTLISAFAIGLPERELPAAILAVARTASDVTRVKLLEAAVTGGFAERAGESIDGLGQKALAALTTDVALAEAALLLEPKASRSAMLAALVDTRIGISARRKILDQATGLRGADFDRLLVTLSDDRSDCALSAAAGILLAEHGDRSRVPGRRSRDSASLGFELCRVLHDPDSERAQKSWLEFLPKHGKVVVTEEEDYEFADRDEEGHRIQRKIPSRSFTRSESLLADLEDDFGNDGVSCEDNTCTAETQDGHYAVTFAGGFIKTIHRYRWRGCGC